MDSCLDDTNSSGLEWFFARYSFDGYNLVPLAYRPKSPRYAVNPLIPDVDPANILPSTPRGSRTQTPGMTPNKPVSRRQSMRCFDREELTPSRQSARKTNRRKSEAVPLKEVFRDNETCTPERKTQDGDKWNRRRSCRKSVAEDVCTPTKEVDTYTPRARKQLREPLLTFRNMCPLQLSKKKECLCS